MGRRKFKNRIDDICVKSDEDARREALFVIQALLRLPSMWDKLPKYILLRLEEIEAYADKEGWEWARNL